MGQHLQCGLCEELAIEPMRIRHGHDGSECRIQIHVYNCGIRVSVTACRILCRHCYNQWLCMDDATGMPRCPWCRQSCPMCRTEARPDGILMAMLAHESAECTACHRTGDIGELMDTHLPACMAHQPGFIFGNEKGFCGGYQLLLGSHQLVQCIKDTTMHCGTPNGPTPGHVAYKENCVHRPVRAIGQP